MIRRILALVAIATGWLMPAVGVGWLVYLACDGSAVGITGAIVMFVYVALLPFYIQTTFSQIAFLICIGIAGAIVFKFWALLILLGVVLDYFGYEVDWWRLEL
jgi:hypothetical protein